MEVTARGRGHGSRRVDRGTTVPCPGQCLGVSVDAKKPKMGGAVKGRGREERPLEKRPPGQLQQIFTLWTFCSREVGCLLLSHSVAPAPPRLSRPPAPALAAAGPSRGDTYAFLMSSGDALRGTSRTS